jgi:adenylate kinase
MPHPVVDPAPLSATVTPVMRLILVGPPGSGKGTQAKLLSQRLGLAHVGTGDMLRQAIRLGTPGGNKAKPFVASGQLVPDDLVNQIIADYFASDDRPERFVMDGYPRTLPQAMAFEQVLRQHFMGLDYVVWLRVSDEEIVLRITGRWVCPNPTCATTYHTTFKPPQVAGVCDLCQTRLIQREDDKEETIRRRLRHFYDSHAALLDHYRTMGLLREVPGRGDIEEIYQSILKALKPS